MAVMMMARGMMAKSRNFLFISAKIKIIYICTMYIFNPEHDLCIANGDIHFVPPESALAFGRDCADITKFMYGLDSLADLDCPAGVGQDSSAGVGQDSSAVAILRIVPWGWNSVLCNRLRKQGIPEELLPDAEKLAAITELSHRRVAHRALEYLSGSCLKSAAPEADSFADRPVALIEHTYRIEAQSVQEVEEFLASYNNIVLKAPLSGSGKGIRFVSDALSHSDAGWCSNLIDKLGYVCVEKRYAPLMEFAMLFRCSGHEDGQGGDVAGSADTDTGVEFVGYSLFYTQNGAYRGNILGSNGYLEGLISKYVPTEVLQRTKEKLMEFLKENVCGRYEGYVGVDQFVCCGYTDSGTASSACADLYYNPVVEINLRLTMGLIARNIYDRFSREYNLVDGEKCFEICRDKKEGKMVYSYRIADI